MDNDRIRKLEKKFKQLFGMVVVAFLILFARLWDLQIMEGASIMVKSRENQTRMIKSDAPRGMIYDRNNQVLVTNRISHNVLVVPDDINKKTKTQKMLCRIIGMNELELQTKLENPEIQSIPYQYLTIKKDIDSAAFIKLLESKFNLQGVEVQEAPVRYYPYKDLACHLFGYVREINQRELHELKNQGYHLGDSIGKTGLERTYEKFLRGNSGGKTYEVDIHGRPLRLIDKTDTIPGNNIHLTIDLKIQEAAEKALDEQLIALQKHTRYKNAKSGTVLALDPRNGNILAMVSKPGFDPNWFIGVMPQETADKLYQDPFHPLTNRNIQGEFAPGSTFKPITVISALLENKATLADKFYCNGYDPIWKKNFPCWVATAASGPRKHGHETIVEGLKNSCNVVMAELSRRVGVKKLADYSRLFGLGKPTGLNLYPGECSGLVPDPVWKYKNTREKVWHPIETAMLGIGQTYLTVTPLQLANVYAAIANNGKIYRPHLVSKITTPSGRLISKFTRELVVDLNFPHGVQSIIEQGLKEVIGDGGTASSAFQGFPTDKYPIAGKTGTAQKPPYDNSGVFACYAPADKPQIVIVVFVEQGGSGSGGAAPIARRILEAFFHLQQRPQIHHLTPIIKPKINEEVSEEVTPTPEQNLELLVNPGENVPAVPEITEPEQIENRN